MRMYLLVSTVMLLSTVLLHRGSSAEETNAGVIDGLVLPSELPLLGWTRVSPADRLLYVQLIDMSNEGVERLIRSDDPLARGLGIFLLSQRGDCDRLLDARSLLADSRRTIPEGMYPHSGLYGFKALSDPSVAGYLRYVYEKWFGVVFPDEQAVNDVFADGVNLAHLVLPWVYRFRLAKDVEDAVTRNELGPPESAVPISAHALRIADVKQRVDGLPPEVRWIVMAAVVEVDRSWGGDPRFYSNAEAAAAFQLAAAELGGRIDPDASPAWSQPGMSPNAKQAAVATLRRLAPNVIAPNAVAPQE